MGSESCPKELFEAVQEVSEYSEDFVSFIVFATHETASLLLAEFSPQLLKSKQRNIEFCLVTEFISMEDEPLSSVRLKKDSSLTVGIQKLKQGKIEAFVTAGNTGALVAYSTITLNPLKGCERSALLAVLPTRNASLAMVDVGGNVTCKPAHLVQQAYIGAAYQRCSLGLDVPKVGLLNIGVESKKGTSEVREAYRILQEKSRFSRSKIDFVGNVEGREVFQGKVDVLVTDGFTGNVLLKTSQGISSFIFEYLQEAIREALSPEVRRHLDQLQRHFSYEEYPGALVCGVDGIVIKCHGAATKKAVKKSILEAIKLVKNNFLEKIKLELQTIDS